MNDTQNVGGRPAIGPAFSVRFPAALLEQIDTDAALGRTTRASWLRTAAEDRIYHTREELALTRSELAPFVQWLLEDEAVAPIEVARVIEKPTNYQDWYAIFRRGGSLDELD